MGFKTLWEGYQGTVNRIPQHPHLGTRDKILEDGSRDYSWKTFREIFEIQNAFARGKSFFLELLYLIVVVGVHI